jgi:hypothetical protein
MALVTALLEQRSDLAGKINCRRLIRAGPRRRYDGRDKDDHEAGTPKPHEKNLIGRDSKAGIATSSVMPADGEKNPPPDRLPA